MRRGTILVLIGALVGVLTAAAHAGRCSGVSDVTFCDDFDRWCTPTPTDPQAACPAGTGADLNLFWGSWVPLPKIGSGYDAAHGLVGPGSWKYQSDGGYMLRVYENASEDPKGYVRLRRSERDMTPEILANPRNTSQAPGLNGGGPIEKPLNTDNTIPSTYVNSMDRTLRPEALKGQFFMHFPGGSWGWDEEKAMYTYGNGAFSRMVSYVELYNDDDRAPFDWTMQMCPGVTETGMFAYNMPKLVRAGDGQVHASFALGVVSLFDDNPCDFDTGLFPTQWRLVAFDGKDWKEFRSGNFDIPHTSPADQADAYPRDGWNFIQFAIGADYIEVRLTNSVPPPPAGQPYDPLPVEDQGSQNKYEAGWIPNPYWVARIPRQYKGPFNRIAIGPNYGTETTAPTCANYAPTGYTYMLCNGGTKDGQACTTSADCPALPGDISPKVSGANTMEFEELVLWDGVFEGPARACCLPDLTCSVVSPQDCAAMGGVAYENIETCSPSPCCPTPWADSDRDSDVDMNDFAALQRCLTIGGGAIPSGCVCFDSDNNGTIDADDVVSFTNVATGDLGQTPPSP